jgi:hypothetical protein
MYKDIYTFRRMLKTNYKSFYEILRNTLFSLKNPKMTLTVQKRNFVFLDPN